MCDKFSKKSCRILHQLYEVIEQRRQNLPNDSYTTTLFLGGENKIVAKFLEESMELIESVSSFSQDSNWNDKKERITKEGADLLYHFLILLAFCNVTLSEVEEELVRRFGISGLTEKASRKKDSPGTACTRITPDCSPPGNSKCSV